MIEYERGLKQGTSVRAPPIALPLRKIARKDNYAVLQYSRPAMLP
jgi:hypothetical protein